MARIELEDDEKSRLTVEIGTILEFIDVLSRIDVDTVHPTSQVTGLSDVWRPDRVVRCNIEPSELLSGAPSLHDGYIKVSKIL